jgi:hypothetical protein
MRMKIVLGAVSALFLGFLVVLYLVARQANPVMLDEKGQPVGASEPGRQPHD